VGHVFSLDLDQKLQRWKFVMVFLLGNSLLCIAVTSVLNVVDFKRVTATNTYCFKRCDEDYCVLPGNFSLAFCDCSLATLEYRLSASVVTGVAKPFPIVQLFVIFTFFRPQ